ncbi:MAG: DNA polymerase IV [bacterium]|nr:DNA polymerase IV [bacterium]
MPEKIILHADFDSFFASVEQQFNPKFRHKPLGVTATNGRTCIIASSREAKCLGIKTGSRTYEAKRICPSIILIPANFIKYLEVSKKFLNICKDYTPYVELFSIDEVFMDITSTVHLFDGAYGIIGKIKARIKAEIGEYITASFGISHNKLLAKLASGLNKPNAVTEIKKENFLEVYKRAKLTDICGIGKRIEERLNKIGIQTLLELRNTSLLFLVSEFGKAEGEFLKNIGFGIDSSPVVPYTTSSVVKSVGRNYCLPRNEYDQRIVLQNVYELCEEVGIKLRRLNKKARTVGFSLSGNIDSHKEKTHDYYFDTGNEIFRSLNRIGFLSEWNPNKTYIRQLSIWVKNLEDTKNLQTSLFDSARQSSLQKTIDIINNRFGDHTIRNGFLLYADKLTTVPNGYMADKYERVKLSDYH